MGPSAVGEGQISADPGACLGDAGIGPQVDFLIFDAPPQTIAEDVVAPSPLCIHADFDLSGVPRFANASSTASIQKSAYSVIDTRHARTRGWSSPALRPGR